MRIFLDGCDGTGKSTLAKYLSKRFKIDIFTLTEKSEKSMKRYAKISDIDNVVCDRTFISEVVYPNVFNREKWLSKCDINVLTMLYKTVGIVVICTASNEAIKDRLLERGDEYQVVIDNIERINDTYRNFAAEHNILLVNTCVHSLEEIGDIIERRLNDGRH